MASCVKLPATSVKRKFAGFDAPVTDCVGWPVGAITARAAGTWMQLGPHVLAIPGTGNPDHLEDNVAAGALRLSPGEMRRLTSV